MKTSSSLGPLPRTRGSPVPMLFLMLLTFLALAGMFAAMMR